MTYWKGVEKELASPLIQKAHELGKPITIAYELQAQDPEKDVKDENTCDCDVVAAIDYYKKNFKNQAGLALH